MSILTSYIDDINTVTDDTISEVIESRIAVCDKNILIYKEYDNVNSYNNIYQESGDSILTKIKNGLKHIWEKIVLVFKSIANKISSLFSKTKGKASNGVNEIADKVVGKNKKHEKTLVGLTGAALITGLGALGYKVIKSKKNKNVVSVTIPADPSSKSISQTKVEVPINDDVTVKKSKDGEITIMMFNTLSNSSTPVENKTHGSRKLPADAYHSGVNSQVYFVRFMKDAEYREELNYIISEIIKCVNGKKINVKDVNNRLNELLKQDPYKRMRKVCGGPKSIDDFDHPEKFEVKITENEAVNAQKFLNENIDRLTSIQSFDKISNVPNDVMDILNNVMNDLCDIQYSANRVMNYINDDARFIYADKIESIKEPAILGEYIMECIKNGFPAKYIAYNAWLISDRSIRGNDPAFKPIWGQTRAIFIPPDKDIIYKIALSSAGMFGNKTEAEFSKQIKNHGGKDLVAEVVNHYNDGINSIERVNTKNIDTSENNIKALETNIKTFISENIPKAKIFDIHSENVGINKNGKLVVIDYGNAYLNKGKGD